MGMKKRFIVIADNREGIPPSRRGELIKLVREKVMEESFQLVDVRVGNEHIEFDVKIEEDRIDKVVEHLNEISTIKEVVKLDDEDEDYDSGEVFERAVQLFNMERFWETHEALEKLWRRSNGYTKEFLHSIILISAAYVHLQKNNRERFFKILARALKSLGEIPQGEYYGVDVAELRRRVEELLKRGEVTFFKLVRR